MFLGCSLFGDNKALETMDLNNLDYCAALVLWKRDDDNDEIKVHEAISFGTIDLTDAHTKKYERYGQDMLPAVESDSWIRLENNGEARKMVIPKDGFLYKVNRVSRADKNTSNNDDHQQNFFTGDGIEDFEVDINKLIG